MVAKVTRDKLAEALLEAEASDRSDRSEIEALWQSIGRYVIPRRGVFQEDMSPGVERNRYVLDSTAPRALELFASFLHNLMNNPALQWLKLRIEGDPEISKERDTRVWLESTEQRMLALFESEATNLYSHLHMVYIDLGAFGTAVLFMEVVGEDLRVRAYHLGDCLIRENEAGFVDTMFRRFHWTPRQNRKG